MATNLTNTEQLAREAKNAYHREYRKKNRKRIRENQKKWREANPDAVRKHSQDYWTRKGEELQAK